MDASGSMTSSMAGHTVIIDGQEYNRQEAMFLEANKLADKLLDNIDTLQGISENLGNIFEELANNPEIDIIKMQMKSAGALGACMTGSGSAVFGIFTDETKAKLCEKELLEDYPFVCICKPNFT